MFEVIRIPAFKDNYIWLLRKGRSAVVVDPGDALARAGRS
jgi:hydroxyacylglutathione hydrolase